MLATRIREESPTVDIKLVRDRLMDRLALHYPAFRWDANKGYGTAEHLAALRRFGPCDIHRRSFRMPGQEEEHAHE